MRKYLLFMVAIMLLNACSQSAADPDAAVKAQAQRFAEAYFNYDFDKACRFVTPESEKWLRFAASNVTQEDVDMINATSAEVSVAVTDCQHQSDSVACVRVIVYNAVLKNNLEQPAYVADEADFALTLVNRAGDYLIKLESLPRNGM